MPGSQFVCPRPELRLATEVRADSAFPALPPLLPRRVASPATQLPGYPYSADSSFSVLGQAADHSVTLKSLSISCAHDFPILSHLFLTPGVSFPNTHRISPAPILARKPSPHPNLPSRRFGSRLSDPPNTNLPVSPSLYRYW